MTQGSAARTSDFAVDPDVHPRHGLLGISVLWLSAALFELARGNSTRTHGSATCNLQSSQDTIA
jgi:hypothetical protein